MTDTLRIGHIIDIDTEQKRDSVHMAIAPIVASERLGPGQHVGLLADGRATTSAKHIGIVDPFLQTPVFAGDKFWIFLYPGSISSLRHDWTHWAFGDIDGAPAKPAEKLKSKEVSEKWLKEFIANADCPPYEDVIKLCVEGSAQLGNEEYYGKSYVDSEYLHFNGRDAHGEIPPEFWDHIEVVTGKKMELRPTYFSCNC